MIALILLHNIQLFSAPHKKILLPEFLDAKWSRTILR
jgi:hypothetical protein